MQLKIQEQIDLKFAVDKIKRCARKIKSLHNIWMTLGMNSAMLANSTWWSLSYWSVIFVKLNFSKLPSTEHMTVVLYKATEDIWPTRLCDWQNIQIFHFGKEMSLYGVELPTDYSTATDKRERISIFSFI